MSNLLSFEFSLSLNDNLIIKKAKSTINKNDSIMLFGLSGSGKSLLLSALAKLLPINGTINYHKTINISQYRHKVSLIHQTPYFIEGTVLENLHFPFTLDYHKHRNFDKHWHINHLEKFNKNQDFLNKDINTLSGGEKQMVNFLRTLQLLPEIILFDEPTSALDETNTNTFFDIFKQHQKTHKTACVWISHNPNHQELLNAQIWQLQNKILYTKQ